ncbi:serine/threonine-protein kinase [Photobacterium aquae]|uniref:serine/threonine-protein kinase n=1 Tax=Photobacterium aquae TaxID=1195763 RepID=UPI00069E7167|nr:serine/threonine-protein kinase [Photobacterium aquae]
MDDHKHNQSKHSSENNSDSVNQHESDLESSDKTLLKIPSDHTEPHLDAELNAKASHSDINGIEGKIIKGRYKIEALIGHGGMCNVYRATDLLLQAAGSNSATVAIKLLQEEFLNQPDAAKSLIREAQKTQQLSHPNIIRVYNFGVEKNAHYLVMEYIDGETLEEVIQRSRPSGLSFSKAMSILNQVISALTYAHEQGVIHADLKPSNIMLTRKGEIKIFDFGVSRALKLNADYYAAEIQDETNALSGYTPTYASPNLLLGEKPELKDDIFAFSCIAYELLTSLHPFQRKPADKAQKENMSASKPKHLNSQQWRTLRCGLEFQAAKRINSFPEFHQKLHKRTWPVVTSLVSACCLAGVVGYGFWQKNIEITQLQTKLTHIEQELLADNQLSQLPASELINTIALLPEEKTILKEGLLRYQQPQILALYEKRINAILNQRDSRFPNYYAVEQELISAQSLYPDSQQLSTLSESITQSWQSTIDMLEDRLNKLLEKGLYFPQENGDDIELLLSDLRSLNKDYIVDPSQEAQKIYTTTLNRATDSLNSAKIDYLLGVGRTFFSDSEQQKELLASASALKKSIQKMDDYHTTVEKDETTPYPYEAATVFYNNQFKQFDNILKKITTTRRLAKLNKEVNTLAKSLPEDFSPLVQIRLSMASRYLKFSDSFLRLGKRRSANEAMKEANELFAQVENAKKIN